MPKKSDPANKIVKYVASLLADARESNEKDAPVLYGGCDINANDAVLILREVLETAKALQKE
jgi:hypothetical protein